jgi:DNA-binding GntR family transcriptional regulator
MRLAMSQSEKDQGTDLAALFSDARSDQLTSDLIFVEVRSAILGRRIAGDERFTEDDLARAFGVSRTPVREALLRLQAERLLERSGRKGLRVSSISQKEIVEIYDLRRALDGLSAELAAQRAAPPEIAHLRWINDRMSAAGLAKDQDEIARLNFEFHESLARSSGNSVLLQKVLEIQDRVRRFERSTLEFPGRWKIAVDEHVQIIEAIQSGESAAASDAAQVHMSNSRKIRLKMVADQNDGPPSRR